MGAGLFRSTDVKSASDMFLRTAFVFAYVTELLIQDLLYTAATQPSLPSKSVSWITENTLGTT